MYFPVAAIIANILYIISGISGSNYSIHVSFTAFALRCFEALQVFSS